MSCLPRTLLVFNKSLILNLDLASLKSTSNLSVFMKRTPPFITSLPKIFAIPVIFAGILSKSTDL